MDSICIEQFSTGHCTVSDCSFAHRLSQLSNPDKWVMFHAPGLEMLDFLPYKYQSHHQFRSVPLPGTGPLVRFASAEDAKTVARDYGDYYSPRYLLDILAQATHGIPKSFSSEVGLESLCRAELGVLSKSVSRLTERSCSDGLSCSGSFCTSPLRRGVLASPSFLSLSSECTGLFSSDEFSSECLSSDSSPSTPSKRTSSDTVSYCNGSVNVRPNLKTDRSSGIIGVLRAQAAQGLGYVGWKALEELWGITPPCLDEAVLTYLARKTPAEQEQILLSFAAIDLGTIQNLSAYLNCLIKEHETTSQVCLHFLAGLCDNHTGCRYIHPVNTAGWQMLQDRWGISYRDFDYAVLNYLSKKPVHQQDEILTLFAEMNLKAVKNRSAYLSSMIERYERVGLRKRTRARGKTTKSRVAEGMA